MIFFMGAGSLRTSVGIAMIWSPLASGRVHQQVDDLDRVSPRQMLLADLLEVGKGDE